MSSSGKRKKTFDDFVDIATSASPLRTDRVSKRARRPSQFAGSPVSTSASFISGKSPPVRRSKKKVVTLEIRPKRKLPGPLPIAPKPSSASSPPKKKLAQKKKKKKNSKGRSDIDDSEKNEEVTASVNLPSSLVVKTYLLVHNKDCPISGNKLQFPSTDTFSINSFTTSDSFFTQVLKNIEERLSTIKPPSGFQPYTICTDGLQHPFFSRFLESALGKAYQKKKLKVLTFRTDTEWFDLLKKQPVLKEDDEIPAESGVSSTISSSTEKSPATLYISIDILILVKSVKVLPPPKPPTEPKPKKVAAPKKITKSMKLPPKYIVVNVMKHMFVRDDGIISSSDSVNVATVHFKLKSVLEKSVSKYFVI